MVVNYTVIKEAYNAILLGTKTIEIRLDNQKKLEVGDHICFRELNGTRQLFVYVDRVICFDNIDTLLSTIDDRFCKFYPYDTYQNILKKEFFGETYGKRVRAIFFHAVKLSIVMPCYNGIPYICETLDSLCKQKYMDYELFFMDDGSTDSTEMLVESFVERIPIHYVKSQHSGPARLRTKGLKMSNAEFIVFLDSDDLFESDYLQEMVKTLESSSADIAIAEFDSFDTEEGYCICPVPLFEDEFLKKSMNSKFQWKEIPDYFRHWTNVPWNKMYRRDFLLRINAFFQELPCSNDVYFSHYTMCNGSILHINSTKAMVHYRIGRKTSISDKHDYFSEIKAYDKICEDLKWVDELTKEKIYDDFLAGIMKCLRWGSGALHKEFFDTVQKEILEEHIHIPGDYLRKRYSWLIKIFETSDYGDEIYRVNYQILKLANLKTEEIKILFEQLSSISGVGVLRLNRDIQYLRKQFEVCPIQWVEAEQWRDIKPEICLCCSALQLTELGSFIRDNGLVKQKFIPLFCM